MPVPAPQEDGPWPKGADSWLEPTQVQKGFYRWGVNIVNRGGIVRSRPGDSVIPVTVAPPAPLIGQPRGLIVFMGRDGTINLVVAIGSQILYTPYPFTAPFTALSALTFGGTGPVVFTKCVVSVVEASDGTLTNIDPYNILMIQDGVSRAGMWDGLTARHLNPVKKAGGGPSETPTGLWSAWSGNRYWVSDGMKVRASNLLNPIKFTEEDVLAGGGFLQFPGMVTGMHNTWDFNELLVFTHSTTSTLLSALLDRTAWAQTTGFQKVIFEGIGCVGGNAIATQWGIVWWYSHAGLIGHDAGLRAYQSSKVTYRDREMAWSKGNISQNFTSGIAMGAFENLLFVSVPSGDKFNNHTWVMDEAPLDVLTYWGYFGVPAWAGVWEGIRPVQWFTVPVQGKERCFCLSQDYPQAPDLNNGDPSVLRNNVWEKVVGERLDNTVDRNLNPVVQRITSSLETKLLGYDGQYKFFRFAEIYLDNVEGEVDLTASYAPRRGGYKQVLQKHIVSSDWALQNPNTQITVNTFVFDASRPQSRVVRTISDAKTYTGPNTGDDSYQNVQTSANAPFPRQKDYAFSILLQWTGRLSISSVRAYFDPEEQETEGISELNESTDRTLDMAGVGSIGTTLTPYVVDPLAMDFQSNAMTGTEPIWIDPQYQSLS